MHLSAAAYFTSGATTLLILQDVLIRRGIMDDSGVAHGQRFHFFDFFVLFCRNDDVQGSDTKACILWLSI